MLRGLIKILRVGIANLLLLKVGAILPLTVILVVDMLMGFITVIDTLVPLKCSMVQPLFDRDFIVKIVLLVHQVRVTIRWTIIRYMMQYRYV